MRPHTLTTPKPMLPIAGKSIVQRLVEDIAAVCTEDIEEVAFVIGTFGEETEEELKRIAGHLNARCSIYYQEEALGTAHAILCAEPALEGKVVIGFADTLFLGNFTLDEEADGIVWVKQVDDPTSFGVVKVDENNIITDFVEKPDHYVSDLAIIGIYYFKDGAFLREELQYLLDNDIKDKGEYQLTNALENMKKKGVNFLPGKVEEWLDCGKKDVTVHTNQRVLEKERAKEGLISESVQNQNSMIIPPCYIGDNVALENAVVGPYASISADSQLKNAVVSNSILQNRSRLENACLTNSMLGKDSVYQGRMSDLSIGDFTVVKV